MKNRSVYVCIASGPSLCKDDLSMLKMLGGTIVAVNNSWEIYPEADIIFAGDYAWWRVHYSRVKRTEAELWTCDQRAACEFPLHYFDGLGSYNSGLRAIELSIFQGAKNIVLLGYDCSLKHGVHWHGAHSQELQNPSGDSISGWKKQFRRLNKNTDVSIINCSSYTELEIGVRMPLREVIEIFRSKNRIYSLNS